MKDVAAKLIALILIAVLPFCACVSVPTIERDGFVPFLRGEPVSDEELAKIKQSSPKDAVFADLLQAYALMRTQNLNDKNQQKAVLSLLETSVATFDDLKDPVNFSQAFSADESKDFRGRPHERMFASLTAAIFHMAQNRCDIALPYLRNAEFLDARFQKLPFGTDAPLVYALMHRCLVLQKASPDDIERAKVGLHHSVRFLTLQEPLIKGLVDLEATDLRPHAIANRVAYMLFEISLYHALLTAAKNSSVNSLLEDAEKNASLFISHFTQDFSGDFTNKILPMIQEQAKVLGLKGDAKKQLEDLTLGKVAFNIQTISDRLKDIFTKIPEYRNALATALETTRTTTETILKESTSPKLMLTFLGEGPKLVREGAYQEISVVRPGDDADLTPSIRSKAIKSPSSCGFHRLGDGGFSVVLCHGGQDGSQMQAVPSFELLSLSKKAMTTQGRKFDRVLEGRAQFRAATEAISEVTLWSSLILFHMGNLAMQDCQMRRDTSEGCYARAYALWGLGAITIVFTGVVWLVGKTSNPSADSRYIHLMYESIYMSKDLGHEA